MTRAQKRDSCYSTFNVLYVLWKSGNKAEILYKIDSTMTYITARLCKTVKSCVKPVSMIHYSSECRSIEGFTKHKVQSECFLKIIKLEVFVTRSVAHSNFHKELVNFLYSFHHLHKHYTTPQE